MQENYGVQLVRLAIAEKEFQHMPMRQIIRKIWSNGSDVNEMGQIRDIDDVSAASEVRDVDEISSVRLYVKVPNDYLVYSQNKDVASNYSDLFGGHEYFTTNYTEVTGGRAKWDWPEPANELQYIRYVEATGGGSVERFENSLFHNDVDFLEIRMEDVLQVMDCGSVDLSLFYYGFSRDKKGFSVRRPVRFQRLYSVHPKSGSVISIVPMVSKGNCICVDISVNVFIDVESLDFLKSKEIVFSDVDEADKKNDIDVRDDSAIMEVRIINALARRWQQEKESFGRSRPHDAYYHFFKDKFPNSIFVERSQLSRRGKLGSNRVLYKILSRLVFDVSRTTGSSENALRWSLDVSALESLKREMPYAGERLLILNEMARNIKGCDRGDIVKTSLKRNARSYGLEAEEVSFLIDILFDGALA